MKIGRNLPKVRRALDRAGRLERAIYVERGTMANAQTMQLADKLDTPRALFRHRAGAGLGGTAVSGSANRRRARSGRRALPDAGGRTTRSLPPRRCTAIAPISTACRQEPDQTRHASDNREEAARARTALHHAAKGANVAVVSGGDPGVFAMAAAVCEEIEAGPDEWRSARRQDRAGHHRHAGGRGAGRRAARPRFLRHLAVRQSEAMGADRTRLDAAAEAGFVIALYNPVSQARPWQLGTALMRIAERLARHDAGDFRPRGRAIRGEHQSDHSGRGDRASKPTWRRWSSSARLRRG